MKPKLKRKEVMENVTLRVEVEPPFGIFDWRIKLATLFFKIGTVVLGIKLSINQE